jgi:plastocyanin
VPRLRAAALSLALAACGNSENLPSGVAPKYAVKLLAYQVTPSAITVPPGQTVLFLNLDDTQDHLLASEATAGTRVRGGVNGVSFELPLDPAGAMPWTVPASAPPGTVLPWFCEYHPTLESGTLTVGP